MASKAIPASILVLRIVTLLALVASVVVLVTDHFTLQDGIQQHFQDIHAYRYVSFSAQCSWISCFLFFFIKFSGRWILLNNI